MYETVGKYLKEIRIQRQITQKQAADYLGLTSPQYVSNFERGLCEPSLEHAVALAKLYKIKVKDLHNVMVEVYRNSIKEKTQDIGLKRHA